MNSAQAITLYQPLLHSIAYKMLKCKEDAEDIVQETFLSWLSTEREKIQNTKAYLIAAVTNNCINHLNALKKKKEQYIDTIDMAKIRGLFKELDLSHFDIEAELSAAFQVLNRKLEPIERAVYLLKEALSFDYETLQEVLDKKQDNCRQLFCRAKKKLNEEVGKINITIPKKDDLLKNFQKACDMGSTSDFINELKKEISLALKKK